MMDIIGFLNEPIPSFFFEALFITDFDVSKPFALTGALASLAAQMIDPGGVAFTEVSGLELGIETGSINEAGWSSPRPEFSRMANGTVTMKRYLKPRHVGIGTFSADPISGWCISTMKAAKTWEHQIQKKSILIFIYHPMIKNPLPVGPASLPIAGFWVRDAFPVKWGVSDLNSTEESQPIIETIEFKYTEIQRLALPPV